MTHHPPNGRFGLEREHMALSRDDEDAEVDLTSRSQHEPQAEPQVGYRIISLGIPIRFD